MSRHTGPSEAVLEVVRGRLDGNCLRCVISRGEQCHHRIPRGMGGTHDPIVNTPPSLVWICQPCHAHIESHRADSYASGWLVRRGADPAGKYLLDLHNHMLMLLPDGGMVVDSLPVLPDYPVPF